MIKRYMKNEFDEDHICTLGLDFATKTHKMPDGVDCPLKVWDTAG